MPCNIIVTEMYTPYASVAIYINVAINEWEIYN